HRPQQRLADLGFARAGGQRDHLGRMTGSLDGAQDSELELEFPPKPESVRMARLTFAALARMRDADDGLVEDTKLAESEACTRAVSANAADAPQEPVKV